MSYRRISEVAEIVGIEEGVVQLNKIFQWNPETDKIDNVCVTSQTLSQIANLSGKSVNRHGTPLQKEILTLCLFLFIPKFYNSTHLF